MRGMIWNVRLGVDLQVLLPVSSVQGARDRGLDVRSNVRSALDLGRYPVAYIHTDQCVGLIASSVFPHAVRVPHKNVHPKNKLKVAPSIGSIMKSSKHHGYVTYPFKPRTYYI